MADQPDPMIAADVSARPDMRDRRRRWLGLLALVLLAAALIWGVWYVLTQSGRVSTDNAYVGADTAQVTPLIASPVAEVKVTNTQAVKKGDILVVLDAADARIDVAEAESALAQAEQRYNQAKANVGAAQGRNDDAVDEGHKVGHHGLDDHGDATRSPDAIDGGRDVGGADGERANAPGAGHPRDPVVG